MARPWNACTSLNCRTTILEFLKPFDAYCCYKLALCFRHHSHFPLYLLEMNSNNSYLQFLMDVEVHMETKWVKVSLCIIYLIENLYLSIGRGNPSYMTYLHSFAISKMVHNCVPTFTRAFKIIIKHTRQLNICVSFDNRQGPNSRGRRRQGAYLITTNYQPFRPFIWSSCVMRRPKKQPFKSLPSGPSTKSHVNRKITTATMVTKTCDLFGLSLQLY